MYNARTDANQEEIVMALRAVGCSVTLLHRVGAGCADILAGKNGVNWLIEVKMPGEKLNARERKWHAAWRGQVAIVESVEQAIELVSSR